jgi:3'(2'), 5'-bisphosphate nucleotidase
LDARRVWVVDPLDGSHEFGDAGRHEWAVHVALVEAGVVTAAAVALPVWEQLLTTRPAPPPPPPLGGRRLRVITSRWRPTASAMAVAQALDAHLVGLGGAGAKAMTVVLGEADVYTAAGLNEWDAAAPAGVALAAGLHVSRFDGRPVTFNQPDPWVPDLLVCRAELADACLAALR